MSAASLSGRGESVHAPSSQVPVVSSLPLSHLSRHEDSGTTSTTTAATAAAAADAPLGDSEHVGPFMMVSPRNGLFFSLPTALDNDTRNGFLTMQAKAQHASRVTVRGKHPNGTRQPTRRSHTESYTVTEEEYRHEGVADRRYSQSDDYVRSDDSGDDVGAGDEARRTAGCARDGSDCHSVTADRFPHCSRESIIHDAEDGSPLHVALESVSSVSGVGDGRDGHAAGHNPRPPCVPQLFCSSNPPVAHGCRGAWNGAIPSSSYGTICGLNSNSGSCDPSPRTNTSTTTTPSLSRCHLSRKDDNFHSIPRYGGAPVSYGSRFTPRQNVGCRSISNSPHSLYRPNSYHDTEMNSFCQDVNSCSSLHPRNDSLGNQTCHLPHSNSVAVPGTSHASCGPIGTGLQLSTESFGPGRGACGCLSCPSCLLDTSQQQLSPRVLADSSSTTPRFSLPAGTPRLPHGDTSPRHTEQQQQQQQQQSTERNIEEDSAHAVAVGPPSREPTENLFTRRRYRDPTDGISKGGDALAGATTTTTVNAQYADSTTMLQLSEEESCAISGEVGEDEGEDERRVGHISVARYPLRDDADSETLPADSPHENEESEAPTPKERDNDSGRNSEEHLQGGPVPSRSPRHAQPARRFSSDPALGRSHAELRSLGSLMVSEPSSLASTTAAAAESVDYPSTAPLPAGGLESTTPNTTAAKSGWQLASTVQSSSSTNNGVTTHGTAVNLTADDLDVAAAPPQLLMPAHQTFSHVRGAWEDDADEEPREAGREGAEEESDGVAIVHHRPRAVSFSFHNRPSLQSPSIPSHSRSFPTS